MKRYTESAGVDWRRLFRHGKCFSVFLGYTGNESGSSSTLHPLPTVVLRRAPPPAQAQIDAVRSRGLTVQRRVPSAQTREVAQRLSSCLASAAGADAPLANAFGGGTVGAPLADGQIGSCGSACNTCAKKHTCHASGA